MAVLDSCLRAFRKSVGFVIPTGVVSTFLGVGWLPAWQAHWASLLSLLLCYVAFYITHGLGCISKGIVFAGVAVSAFFLEVAGCLFLLGMVSVYVFKGNKGTDSLESSEEIVVQVAFGQLLAVGLSMPATLSFYAHVGAMYDAVCAGVFMCPLWVNHFAHFLIFFSIPFVFFNVVEVIKPWPMSLLQLKCSSCFAVMSEGMVLALYSALFMYFIAFLCSGLTVQQAAFINKCIVFLIFGKT